MKPLGDLVRALGWITPAIVLGGCSTDLFHSTDWRSACDGTFGPGCSAESAAEQGSGGAGGESTHDAPGDFTSASTGAIASAGAGGAAGAASTGGADAGGAGGAGGDSNGTCSSCNDVGQVVYDGSASPPPSTLCPGAAQDAWDAAYACICSNSCQGECSDTACQIMEASNDCKQCALDKCVDELQQCEAN